MAFVVCSNVQQTNNSFERPLKLRRENKYALLCFRSSAEQTSNLLCVRRATPAKYSIYCLLKLCSKDNGSTIVLSKNHSSKILHVLCVSNAQHNNVCTLFLIWKALPSDTLYLRCFLGVLNSPSSVYHLSLCFRGIVQHSLYLEILQER